MLNETASSREARPQAHFQPVPDDPPEDRLQISLHEMVAAVMDIEEMTGSDDAVVKLPIPIQNGNLAARFVGRLKLDSEIAYDRLDSGLKPMNHLPVFREENGKHVILLLRGRVNPRPRAWWPNLLLFVLTLVSVLMVGAELALDRVVVNSLSDYVTLLISNLWRGIPYAASIMLILGGHELGHYFAARRHGLAVTLPYFIPLPLLSPFGTLGAFIQLRQPMRNRKMLFDVGASGPLVGLAFAVPILFIGLAGARVGPITPGGVYEGDSLLYAFAKIVTFGQFLPSNGMDVYIDSSQLAWAGWTGLLVSALNLIPIGQLDGGHILYSLLGDRARYFYYPLIAIMVALVFVTQVWMLWVVLLLIFGRVYATPLDTITPLGSPRRALGVLTLVIFLLIFVPAPLTPNSAGPQRQPTPRSAVFQPIADHLFVQ
jgi:membrane-associated protease RseP (regulator of RpoE activity)